MKFKQCVVRAAMHSTDLREAFCQGSPHRGQLLLELLCRLSSIGFALEAALVSPAHRVKCARIR